MLERIDFAEKKTKKKGYKEERKALMDQLVLLQQQAREAQVGFVVLFEGWDGAGKGSRLSDLLYLMDARATSVHLTKDRPADETELFSRLETGVTSFDPLMKEFWQALGERGTVTFYDCGWYHAGVEQIIETEHERHLAKAKKKAENPRVGAKKLVKAAMKPREDLNGHSRLDICLESIESFERALTDNGYVVIKFFAHITARTQFDRLMDRYANSDVRWLSEREILNLGEYDAFYELQDYMLEQTDYTFAPWHVLNGEDKRGANLDIARTLVSEMQAALEAKREKDAQPKVTEGAAPALSRYPITPDYPLLENVEHDLVLNLDDYREQLEVEQELLHNLELQMYQQRVPMMLMFEGWDAAGKGGSIKRVAQALDARAYNIFPSPAPTKAELAHPHLWRYWTRLPKAGHVGIYDRSWYGRVLVERVEGLASHEEWSRAYDEINEFERDMIEWGAILIKFWVNISEDEQLNRFKARQEDPQKQWKITDEDWRNREKNPQYAEAIQDMFRLTSTTYAPWTILESDNKQYARIKALRTINDALEARLN